MPPPPVDPAPAILAAVVEPVLVADAGGRCLDANQAALALLGCTLDELRGRAVADLVDDGGAATAGAAAATRDRFLAGTGWAAELDLRRADGAPVPVEAHAAPLAVGGAVQYAVFLRDATHRRADGAAARERDADFRAAFEDAAVGAALVALDGRFLRANPALRALLGYAEGELPGRSFRDVTHPDDLDVGADQLRRLVAGEIGGYRVEKRYLRKDGGVVWAHLSTALVRGADGEPRYLVSQIQDVTAERAAADALRASEARFRAVWESTSEGIALSGPDGTVLAANPAYLALYGSAEDEVVGRPFSAIVPEERRAWAEAGYRAAFADPAPAVGYEARIVRKDGTERDVEARADFVVVDGARVALVSTVRDVTERKAAEAAAQVGEERLRLALAAAGMATWDWDAATGRVVRSEGMPALYGLAGPPSDEPDRYLSLVHPDDRGLVAEADQRVVTGSDGYAAEYRVVRPDGAVRWLREVGEAERDATGRPVRILGVTQDVTDRRRAGEEARAAAERFRALVERLPALVSLSEPTRESRTLYVNPFVEALLGYRPDEYAALAESWPRTVHPEDRQAVVAEVARVFDEGGAFRMEYRRVAKDGRVVWVKDESVLVRDADGAPRYWQTVQVDVTDLKEAGAALGEQATLLAALVEAQAAVAEIGPDPDAVVRLLAERACTLTGAAGSGVAVPEGDGLVYRAVVGFGRAIEGAWYPAAGSLTGLCLRTGEVLRTGDSEADPRIDRVLMRAAGARSLVVAPLRHRGEVVGALSINAPEPGAFGDRDEHVVRLLAGLVGGALHHADAFAALRAAKEAAEEASRLKGGFLSTMSHELRTPLNAIMGYAGLLLEGLAGELTPQQAGDVGHIAAGADRLLGLVDDVLDLSRMEAGRLALDREPVELAALAEGVRSELAPLAAAKGLALTVDAPDGLVVVADPLRLRQVLLNLVGNAVKFTERGSVTVAAWAVSRGVKVAVRDTGIGIAPDVLPHVFDEFRQADPATTRRYGGTGLGLAISKRLVELHGGAIAVESEPGVGSTFTVRLPGA